MYKSLIVILLIALYAVSGCVGLQLPPPDCWSQRGPLSPRPRLFSILPPILPPLFTKNFANSRNSRLVLAMSPHVFKDLRLALALH